MITDNSGALVHPPLLFLAALVVGSVLQHIWPLPLFAGGALRALGGIIALIGTALLAWGRHSMVSHGTNVNPTKPTTTIVTSGPYRFSRNPLYLSLTIVYLGLTLALDTGWTLLLLVPVLLVMHFAVVLREERYLQTKFGDSYGRYRARVRRYL